MQKLLSSCKLYFSKSKTGEWGVARTKKKACKTSEKNSHHCPKYMSKHVPKSLSLSMQNHPRIVCIHHMLEPTKEDGIGRQLLFVNAEPESSLCLTKEKSVGYTYENTLSLHKSCQKLTDEPLLMIGLANLVYKTSN